MAIKQTTAVRNAQLDALNSQTGTSAKLRIYNGTRPANANTAITSQTMLVELTCNASAFAAAASGGVLISGSAALNEAADTMEASGWQSAFGLASITEAPDIVTAYLLSTGWGVPTETPEVWTAQPSTSEIWTPIVTTPEGWTPQ